MKLTVSGSSVFESIRQSQRVGRARLIAMSVLFGPLLAFSAILAVFGLAVSANAQSDNEATVDNSKAKPARFAYYSEVSTNQDQTGITLKFDGKPDYRLFFMENPRRFVIELHDADFRLGGEQAGSQNIGLVSEIRSGRITQRKSRMVVTLSEPAMLSSDQLEKADDSDRYSLRLDLAPVAAGQFAEIIKKQQAFLGSSGETVVKGDRIGAAPRKEGHFTIVIDPGHGGIDSGASGVHSDVLEKDIVLEIGMLLGSLIEKSGPFEVLYTRQSDVFVSLRERQRFTRRSNADLLISLHADSLRQNFVRGATVYTLAKKASDSLSRQLAESENLSDVIAGMAAPDAQDEVTNILADLTMRETTRYSRSFSALLVEQLKTRIKLINNPRRSASFMVLKNAENPGVLIELGYLSNSEDEARLTDPKWQEKVAALIAETVREFFQGRQPVSGAN